MATSLIYEMVLVAYAWLYLSGSKLPMFSSDRTAFLVPAVIGAVMCTTGVKGLDKTGFANPFNILGYVAGVLNLLLLASVLFGFSLPLIASTRSAVIALAVLISVKITFYFIRTALQQRPAS
jgi:hypothetical protein